MIRLVLAVALGLSTLAGVASRARAQGIEGLGVPPSGARPEEKIEAGKLSKLPKLVKFVPADYPKEAVEKGIEAEVVLLLDVDAKGKVSSVAIAEPSASPGMGFEEAALAAAQQFEFEPAEMDGKPIAVQLPYRYKFKLTPAAPAPAPAPPGPDAGAPEAPPRPDAGAPEAPAAAAPTKEPVANFTGILRERGTRLPIAGALVTVFRDDGEAPVGFEANADAEGRFRFFDLAPGPWKVLSEPPGYYPFRTTETITAGEAVDVVYFVEKGSYNPYDVTVTALRPRKEVSRTVIAAKEIEKIPGTAGDPLAVVQNFAGVARPFAFSGLIIVRGSAPEDSRVFVDGATVPLIYHFGGLRSVIPVGILDSIEFYPGNFAPTYGRATGGVIDVQIKKLQPKKVGGYADVNLFDTGVFLEIPLGDKGGVALAGRRSYADVIINAVVPENAPVDVVAAPRYYDYQLLANYRPAPAHDLRAFLFGSDDRLEFLFRNPAEIDSSLTSGSIGASTTFYRGLLTYRYVPSDRFENVLRVAQGTDWLNFGIGGLFVFDIDLQTTQLRDNARYRFGDHLTVSGGADILYTSADLFIRAPLPPKEGMPPPFEVGMIQTTALQGVSFWSPAAFVEAEWKPVKGLFLLPGLRLDYFERTKQAIPQPRFTARYQIAPRVTAKAGVGLFVQEPDFDETDPAFGTPGLTAEKAWHYSAGVEFKPRDHITLDFTSFYKDLSNLVSASPDPGITYDNRGVGNVRGLELVARHEFTNNFAGWLAYTLMRSVRTDSGATEERLFDFDQTHILTLIGTYTLPRNWMVGGRFRLVSGNPITPIVGGVFNASTDRYDPVYGGVNTGRNPMFNQLDVRIDKRWIYRRWILGVYLDIQNVYNQANAEGVTHNFNFRQSERQTGLPLFTILGVRGEF